VSIISSSAHSSGDASFYSFPISSSLRFDGSSYLLSSAFSGAVSTFTVSLWLKRSRLKTGTYDLEGFFTVGDSGGGAKCSYNFSNAQKLNIYDNTGSDATSSGNIIYRDLSAFYHIVIVSNSGTVSFYKNGVLDFTDDRVSTTFGSGDKAILGGYSAGGDLFSGYIAEVNFIDGTALTPTSFGETKNGVWVPKDPSGLSYGTNGFRLTFSNASDLGEDSSGNNNDWTVN